MTPEAAAAVIRRWLSASMAETGMSASVWAKRAGVAPSTIQRALKPEYAFVTSSRTLAKLAAVANRPPPEINVAASASVAPQFLPVRHRVQAGHWLEADSSVQVEFAEPRPVAPDPRFAGIEQWLEQVVGDSVNERIADGGFAHVVNAIAIHYEPRGGDLVVVERQRGGGLLSERTIKEIVLTSSGVELHPRSTNPRWRPLVLTDGAEPNEDMTVQIVGLVIGAYQSFGG